MSGYLLIPMNLQALWVRKPADPSVDFLYDLVPVPRTKEALPNWYGRPNYSFSFEKSKLEPALRPGVHLHWALPEALTHAHYHERKKPEQLYIPNRWLVLRMWHRESNPTISSRGWIVESDFVSDDDKLGGVPFLVSSPPPDVKPEVKFVGRTLPLEGWKEDTAAKRLELKSFGWGDPSFAAYYPACRSVLGFHDSLAELSKDVEEADPLTYLVIGWYADKTRDPLDRRSWPKTIENSGERLTGLRWSCSDLANDTLPDETLCHGVVVSLKGRDKSQSFPERFSGEKPVAIAIGGSPDDALAALLAPNKVAALQQVLRAFLYGQADELRDNDQLGELLHRQTFNATPGGERWTLEPPAPSSDADSTPLPPSPTLLGLLDKLNEAQRNLDRHLRKIESLRWQLFACWAAWASKQRQRAPRSVMDSAIQELTNAKVEKIPLSELTREFPGLTKELSYQELVERCKKDVEAALATEKTRLKVAKSTMPAFLQPKDPFVLLTGEHLNAFDRTRPQRPVEDAARVLQCRLVNDVVSAVKQSGTVSTQASAAKCFDLNFSDRAKNVLGDALADVGHKLALEALLFDPNCASLIHSKEKNLNIALLKELQEDLNKPSKSNSGTTISWEGQTPDPLGISRWNGTNPWLPVYLLWQASWEYTHPKDSDYSRLLEDGWELDAKLLEGDLVPKLEDRQMQHESASQLEGATIISVISGRQLAGNLTKFGRSRSLTVEAQMSKIEDTSVLGQSLGGFNDLLLRQTAGLCLPPLDPTDKTGKTVDAAVWKDAMCEGSLPLLPSASRLLPLRAGNLMLKNLYLVDAFGQIYKLIDEEKPPTSKPTITASPSLHPRIGGYDASLSPRLAQPARLNFDWQPAGTDAYGPVCGWLVPNFLEKSFAVFSASGAALGALESVLQAEGEKTINSPVKFKWSKVPGSTRDIADIVNTHLRGFAKLIEGFSAEEGTVFLELIDLILRKSEERRAPEDPRLSVLLGRPLAVVQASLSLELQGLPAGYWKTDSPWKFETEGFEKLRVPVRLGGMNLRADGLIAYLRNGVFSPSDGATRRLSNSNHIKYDQKLDISCADSSPLTLTLLMDASARVHATTGILPRHSIELPPEVGKAASRIEDVYFNVAPVLGSRPKHQQQPNGDKPPVVMPRPSDAFGRWSWATRHTVGWRDIQPADDRARFAEDLALSEGWLKLSLRPEKKA
jgi:hypothetical protein